MRERPKEMEKSAPGRIDAEVIGLAEDLRRVVGDFVRKVRSDADTPTSAQIDTLGYLDRNGPMTVADLARLRNVRHQSMRLVIAQLETEALVERADNPQDQRSRLVVIAPRGREALATGRQARSRWISAAIADRLSAAEQAELRRAIKLLEALLA